MKKLLLVFVILFYALAAFAQTYSLSPSPGNSLPSCPGITKPFSITVSSGSLPSCTYTWTVTNGRFPDHNNATTYAALNLTSINVQWNDTHNGGNLKVEVSGCTGGSPTGELASSDYAIASFFGQTFAQVGSEDALGTITYGTINIPFCTVPTITIWVDHMYMNNTGGAGQTGLVEAIYVYTIPSGWKQYGTNYTGGITSTLNTIVITPIPGATQNCADGDVHVSGLVPPSFSCGSPSNQAIIPIHRTGSVSLSLSPSNYSGPSCGDHTPITFTASTTFSCGTTYTWSKPSGWSGASTSNTITLTPSGSPSDVGTITATINLGCSNSPSASYTTPAFKQPTMTGPDPVCSQGTFALSNALASNVTWSSSDSGILTVDSNGVGTRVGNASGQVTVIATFNCGINPVSKTLFVGIPDVPGPIVGNTSPNIGYTEFYYTTPTIGASSYNWYVPKNFPGCSPFCWSISRYNDPTSLFVNVGTDKQLPLTA